MGQLSTGNQSKKEDPVIVWTTKERSVAGRRERTSKPLPPGMSEFLLGHYPQKRNTGGCHCPDATPLLKGTDTTIIVNSRAQVKDNTVSKQSYPLDVEVPYYPEHNTCTNTNHKSKLLFPRSHDFFTWYYHS